MRKSRGLSPLYMTMGIFLSRFIEPVGQWIGLSHFQMMVLCLIGVGAALALALKGLNRKWKAEHEAMERRFAEEDLRVFGHRLN